MLRSSEQGRDHTSEGLDDRIEDGKNPRNFGEPLHKDMPGSWRYRVWNYRIICEIQEHQLVVLALTIGHRREIYLSNK